MFFKITISVTPVGVNIIFKKIQFLVNSTFFTNDLSIWYREKYTNRIQ